MPDSRRESRPIGGFDFGEFYMEYDAQKPVFFIRGFETLLGVENISGHIRAQGENI